MVLIDVIERHGWHAIGELAVLALVAAFAVVYVTALLRGRVRAIVCASCGRIASRSDFRCPRCGESLDAGG